MCYKSDELLDVIILLFVFFWGGAGGLKQKVIKPWYFCFIPHVIGKPTSKR